MSRADPTVNPTINQLETAFSIDTALAKHDFETVLRLIQKDADKAAAFQQINELKKFDIFKNFINQQPNQNQQEIKTLFGHYLFLAIQNNDLNFLNTLLELGADITVSQEKIFILEYAAQQKAYGFIRKLLSSGLIQEDRKLSAWESFLQAEDLQGLIIFIIHGGVSANAILYKALELKKFTFAGQLFEGLDDSRKTSFKGSFSEDDMQNAIRDDQPELIHFLLKIDADKTIFKREMILNYAVFFKAYHFLNQLSPVIFRQLIEHDNTNPCAWEKAVDCKEIPVLLLFMQHGVAMAAIYARITNKESTWQFMCELMHAQLQNNASPEFFSAICKAARILAGSESDYAFLTFMLEKSVKYHLIDFSQKILEKISDVITQFEFSAKELKSGPAELKAIAEQLTSRASESKVHADRLIPLLSQKQAIFENKLPLTRSFLKKLLLNWRVLFTDNLPSLYLQLNQFYVRIAALPISESLSSDQITTLIMIIENAARDKKNDIVSKMMISVLEASPTIMQAQPERIFPRDAVSALSDFYIYEMVMCGKNEFSLAVSDAISFIMKRYANLTQADIETAFRDLSEKKLTWAAWTAGLFGFAKPSEMTEAIYKKIEIQLGARNWLDPLCADVATAALYSLKYAILQNKEKISSVIACWCLAPSLEANKTNADIFLMRAVETKPTQSWAAWTTSLAKKAVMGEVIPDIVFIQQLLDVYATEVKEALLLSR